MIVTAESAEVECLDRGARIDGEYLAGALHRLSTWDGPWARAVLMHALEARPECEDLVAALERALPR